MDSSGNIQKLYHLLFIRSPHALNKKAAWGGLNLYEEWRMENDESSASSGFALIRHVQSSVSDKRGKPGAQRWLTVRGLSAPVEPGVHSAVACTVYS